MRKDKENFDTYDSDRIYETIYILKDVCYYCPPASHKAHLLQMIIGKLEKLLEMYEGRK